MHELLLKLSETALARRREDGVQSQKTQKTDLDVLLSTAKQSIHHGLYAIAPLASPTGLVWFLEALVCFCQVCGQTA